MFKVQQVLCFILSTTSENYWNNFLKATYSWAVSLLVFLWHTALTLRCYLYRNIFFLLESERVHFPKLIWRRMGCDKLSHQQKADACIAVNTVLDKTVKGNKLIKEDPELLPKRF